MLVIQSLFDQNYLKEIDEFIGYGHKQGLEILLEVHTKEEFQNALKTEADIIGINNRNLDTLEIDLKDYRIGSEGHEKSRIILSESGINTVRRHSISKKVRCRRVSNRFKHYEK